jgi:Zn finger protein HypA/HybF involved in hydrogenase expression
MQPDSQQHDAGPSVVPCRTCGAAMRECAGETAVDVSQLQCEYCGNSETLPLEQSERLFIVRSLASSRQWSVDPLRGPLVDLLGRFEDGRIRHSLLGIALMLLTVLGVLAFRYTEKKTPSLLTFRTMPGVTEKALLQMQRDEVFSTLFVPLLLLATGLGVGAAAFRARSALRRELAPLVLEAVPEDVGKTISSAHCCRRCGAELPETNRSLRDCAHCGSANIVSAANALRIFVRAARAASTRGQLEVDELMATLQARFAREFTMASLVSLGGAFVMALVVSWLVVTLK